MKNQASEVVSYMQQNEVMPLSLVWMSNILRSSKIHFLDSECHSNFYWFSSRNSSVFVQKVRHKTFGCDPHKLQHSCHAQTTQPWRYMYMYIYIYGIYCRCSVMIKHQLLFQKLQNYNCKHVWAVHHFLSCPTMGVDYSPFTQCQTTAG